MKRVAFALAAAAFATSAQAQEISIDPDHITAVLKQAGYPAENFNDDADYRQILTKSGNYQFLVEMSDCQNGTACQTIGFYSNFPMDTPPTKEKLDAYGGPLEGTRLSLDRRGAARLDQDLDMGENGISDEDFISHLKTFETVLAGVKAYLAGQPAPAPVAAAQPAAASADAPAAPPEQAANAS
jgi:hypothetical protein